MRHSFLIVEKFEPKESNKMGLCIWCLQPFKKNKAHIFSKRIIGKNSPENLLRASVCIKCNAALGKSIEDFLFKKTPLAFIADIFLKQEHTSLKWIPNYVWSNSLSTWIIVIPDKDADEILPPQIMLNAENKLQTFIQEIEGSGTLDLNRELIRAAQAKIIDHDFTIHKGEKYPENFLPRAFFLNKKLVLTGKNDSELLTLREKILEPIDEDSAFLVHRSGNLTSISQYQINFRWNVKLYFDYCAKIAFEIYALIKGSDHCISSDFYNLRNSIFAHNRFEDLTIIYEEQEANRSFSNKLVPEGYFSYCPVNEKIALYPLIDFENHPNHCVYIYENSDGFVCATVKLFNIHTAKLILGKTTGNQRFNGWRIDYEILTGNVKFFKIVTEQEKIDMLQVDIDEKLPKDATIVGFDR